MGDSAMSHEGFVPSLLPTQGHGVERGVSPVKQQSSQALMGLEGRESYTVYTQISKARACLKRLIIETEHRHGSQGAACSV